MARQDKRTDFPPKAVEIMNEEKVIEFRYVPVDASISETDMPPVNGLYKNVILEYLNSGNTYIYSSDGIAVKITPEGGGSASSFDDLTGRPKYANSEMTSSTNIPDVTSAVAVETDARELAVSGVQSALDGEIRDRADGDDTLSGRIDTLSGALDGEVLLRASGDETNARDIAGEVLAREQADGVLAQDISDLQIAVAGKQGALTAGDNISIVGSTISATDTTYSDFTGTDGTVAGAAGLVPAPAFADAGKVLGAGGTWVPEPTRTSDLTNDGADNTSTYVEADELATVATTGSYTDLINKPSIPSGQVQSDWTQADNTSVDYIKNKPSLSTVATSGSYTDLLNKPTIPAAQVNADWTAVSGVSVILNKPSLATVATSGSYTDLSNTPSIPAAQVQSDWAQSDSAAIDYIKSKPTLATVATSGNYADLSNTPDTPVITMQTTDPGEGVSLAANNFIGVYQ